MTQYNFYLRILRFAKEKVIPKSNKALCLNVPFSHTKGYCYCSPARQTAGTALWASTAVASNTFTTPASVSQSRSFSRKPPRLVVFPSLTLSTWQQTGPVRLHNSRPSKAQHFSCSFKRSFPSDSKCFHKCVSGWELSILTIDVINFWHSRG